MTDPIADMLTRVRNAVQAKHQKVDMPASRLKVDIARILKEEGYIAHFKTADESGKQFLTLFLKYGENRNSEGARWSGHQHSYDVAWRHDRQASAQAGIWRRAAVQHLLRG